MNRKEIKKEAKKSIKREFLKTILVVFIAGIIINGGYNYGTYRINTNENIPSIEKKTIGNAINNFIYNINQNFGEEKHGFIAPLIDNITESKSVSVGLINSINTLVFNHNLDNSMVSVIAFLISLIFYIFVQNVLIIGKIRYFLELRRYRVKVDKLLFPYQVKRWGYIANIMFTKALYQLLWFLTIIGGFIKIYEYKMIPYVLAENPCIKKKEAFRLSKELTNGYKFELFKLDLSLIGWYILQILTLGFSSLFYFNAYKEAIYAEVYMKIRNEQYASLTDKSLLNDTYLIVNDYQNTLYPKEKFSIPIESRFKGFDIDYSKTYDLMDYVLFFFTFSMIGWLWEVMFGFISTGTFINRGTMHGPWLPIYGYGGVLILLVLKPLRNKPILFFITTMLLAGVIEYATACYLEIVLGYCWWTYEGYFLNLNNRICLEGLLVFGFGGAAITYFVAPILNNLYAKIKPMIRVILCILLIFSYLIDYSYTQTYPNVGNGITTEIIK